LALSSTAVFEPCGDYQEIITVVCAARTDRRDTVSESNERRARTRLFAKSNITTTLSVVMILMLYCMHASFPSFVWAYTYNSRRRIVQRPRPRQVYPYWHLARNSIAISCVLEILPLTCSRTELAKKNRPTVLPQKTVRCCNKKPVTVT